MGPLCAGLGGCRDPAAEPGAVKLGKIFETTEVKDGSCFACGVAEKGSAPKVELDGNPFSKGTNAFESVTDGDGCENMFRSVEFALTDVTGGWV
jgi:hypothetical protein